MRALILAATLLAAAPAAAQQSELDLLRAELARARAQLDRQEARLRALETRLANGSGGGGSGAAAPPDTQAEIAAATPPSVPRPTPSGSRVPERVGQGPAQPERPPEVAVLGDQGSIVTRRGQLTGELQFDYARADRNRAIARGISLVDVINIGIFNLNEVRQDVLTASGQLRYGLTKSIEVGVRVPFVYRDETFILSPLPGDNQQGPRTIDSSTNANGIGDVEMLARYQIARARGGWPFLIGNLQAVVPTGSDPFKVARLEDGTATEAATGAGFYAVAPSLTAILPTDPAVLFGTIGYSHNFGRDVNTLIAGTLLRRVEPGDAISFSAGIGIALNQRTTLNLGYAHSWVMGTYTEQRTGLGTPTDPFQEGSATSRDLQLGRLLFGVTYRTTQRSSVNWSVEVGATDDATDLRTVLRLPFTILTGR